MRLLIGKIIEWLGKKEFLNFIADDIYLKILYSVIMGKKLNLINPITLNEKIQWIKIYDRKTIYKSFVDKIKVREFVQKCIGPNYLTQIIGVYENFDDIDFEQLPEKFVLKCSHDSGSCVICQNKNNFNRKKIRRFINQRLKVDFFWFAREWAYKGLKPKIIVEKYMEDECLHELRDYKFYCFKEIVECVLVCMDRNIGKPKFYFFDKEWNLKRYNIGGKNAPPNFTIPKPQNLEKMFEIAQTLSLKSKAYFIRVDLYNINGKIYFSELTLYPDSGMDVNRLPETDLYFGSLVKLPIMKNV